MSGGYSAKGYIMGYTESGAPCFKPDNISSGSWQSTFSPEGMNYDVAHLQR
jgi:hypothetical protein